jgi:hypothetical protein
MSLQLLSLSPQDMHNQCIGTLALLSAHGTVFKNNLFRAVPWEKIHPLHGKAHRCSSRAPECCHNGAGPTIIFLVENGVQDQLTPFTLSMIALHTFGARLARQKALLQLPNGGGDDVGAELSCSADTLNSSTSRKNSAYISPVTMGMRRPLSRASCTFAMSSSITLNKSSSKSF